MNPFKFKKKVLVITPCPRLGLPTQGFKIAERLREAGFRISILSKAQSSFIRVLDMVFRGFLFVPFHNVVLVNLYGERAFVYESFIILYTYLWKKRIVVFVRSGLMPEFVRRFPRWTRVVLLRADLVLVPNGFLQQKLTALGLRVDGAISNFIDLEQYTFRERSQLKPSFLYVRGFFNSLYNPEMALRAFAIIQRKYPDATLTMAGREGDCSAMCRKLVSELSLSNVNFVGLLQKNELIALANKHDIHLHTNRVENMPVSIIEMWACGLPIVGTNVGGMPYLVRDNEDAILVESEDFQAMAEACLNLLSNADLARRFSNNGRRRVQELVWERIKSAWLKALFVNE
ncbi:MAG TPA: glycosyltransferase family 4 protein [Nitrospirales bacterium]|nr:glycosyltransferase family 4 protein [Nitrospirales bacterium]